MLFSSFSFSSLNEFCVGKERGAGGGRSLASTRFGDDEAFRGGVCCFNLARAARVNGVFGDKIFEPPPPPNGDTDTANSFKLFKLVFEITTLRLGLGLLLLLLLFVDVVVVVESC